ncbi:hypothetical protein [Nocardiopsis trehalosi]|jgi:hypothetical protein|uniref:hypothetical protein n=1 Tax=Nocardiopsis trehalosi TaxID=109329 RepID=UPI00082ADE9D|nr:hypothetical protein [Nocardiopsis trehalosi]
MSRLNPRRGLPGALGTAVLGSLCLGGALAYTFAVGGSLMAQPDASPAQTPVDTVSEANAIPEAPVGLLRISVIDQGRAYVQNLACTGDPDADPAACGHMAQVQADLAEDGDDTSPFAEVPEGAVCTEELYGPQEAVITGTWQGAEIDTEVTRVGSCEEARWQRLRPVTDPLV